MKKQTWIVTGLAAALLMLFVYTGTLTGAMNSIMPPKVGVVDVTTILENSQKHKDWQAKMKANEEQVRLELQQMQKELEALQAQIKTRTVGSKDYMDMMQDYMQKKAVLESKSSFYEDRVTMEMQQWTETLYKEFIQVVDEVAAKNGLDMVLAREKIDFPAPSLRDFMLTVKTSKIIYCRKNLDITDEVLQALDNKN